MTRSFQRSRKKKEKGCAVSNEVYQEFKKVAKRYAEERGARCASPEDRGINTLENTERRT